MSEDTLALIGTLLAERAIGASVETVEAELRYKADPDCPRNMDAYLGALAAEIKVLRAQNEFQAFIGECV